MTPGSQLKSLFPLYSVGTWDGVREAYTAQEGLSIKPFNVERRELRTILKELRALGFTAHRRGSDRSDSDPSVIVERTDGQPVKDILEGWSKWR